VEYQLFLKRIFLSVKLLLQLLFCINADFIPRVNFTYLEKGIDNGFLTNLEYIIFGVNTMHSQVNDVFLDGRGVTQQGALDEQ
jgi:hypothetical protein